MGLDMYLTKEIFIGAKYKHRKVKGTISITIDGNPIDINVNKISTITEDFLYWRKANAIHKWFVENIQEGEDDCKKYEVFVDDLIALREACQKTMEILDNVPEERVIREIKKDMFENTYEYIEWDLTEHEFSKLPLQPTEGFFFGDTEINIWFYQDIKETFEKLKDIEKYKDNWEISFTYTSSW